MSSSLIHATNRICVYNVNYEANKLDNVSNIGKCKIFVYDKCCKYYSECIYSKSLISKEDS